MEALRARKDGRKSGHHSTVALWLEFIVLTGVRVSEVRLAQWKEFDFEHMVWNVPPGHRKTGYRNGEVRPVPISKPMLAVLEQLQKRRFDQSPDAVVFRRDYQAYQDCGPMHYTAVSRFLREGLKWETKITAHGFRSTLRDWCRAQKFPAEWWEIQVDHVFGNKTSQSYGHDTLIEQRRGMMELWGEYCSRPAPEPKAGDVVHLSDKRRVV